jgi:hypothetical protein
MGPISRFGRPVVMAAFLSAMAVFTLPGVAQAGQPMGNYAPVTSSVPWVQYYDITTTTPYWSVGAIKPSPDADYDMQLTDAQNVVLASSTMGQGKVDFVAINSNVRPFPTLYGIKAWLFGYPGTGPGKGSYTVEFAQGTDSLRTDLPHDYQPVAMYGGFVAVRDVYLLAGHDYELTIAKPNPGPFAMGESYLLRTSPGPTLVGRSGAMQTCTFKLDQSNTPIGGNYCHHRLVPTESGWYGLVAVTYSGDLAYVVRDWTVYPT